MSILNLSPITENWYETEHESEIFQVTQILTVVAINIILLLFKFDSLDYSLL